MFNERLVVLFHDRATVMSGSVRDYATKFRFVPGPFGGNYIADGPFHISVSRDAIMVHQEVLKSEEDTKYFEVAMVAALNHYRNEYPLALLKSNLKVEVLEVSDAVTK